MDLSSSAAHIHHVLPRKLGGSNAADNLVTLCEGCHSLIHPNLQASLARRTIERWAWRLARLLNRKDIAEANGAKLGAILRLLGVRRLRPGQLGVILAAMRGEDILMVSPTGSGKSICFQVPSLANPGHAYVIEPLKALMVDQVASLHRKSIPASFMNGDLARQEKLIRYTLLKKRALKFLYCSPERFNPKMVRLEEVTKLIASRPSFLVVDEAHCVDKWGQDFRPDYGRLSEVRRQLGNPPVLAFTATASAETRKRILHSLNIPNAKEFLFDVDRPNIVLIRLEESSEPKRLDGIASLISASARASGGKSMIFAPTKNIGEMLCRELKARQIDAPFYHGRLKPSEREFIQQRFMGTIEPRTQTIVCTNAFGMGIDIPDVRLVVHWQHPMSVEDYLQEFGRAGRDGKKSLAALFVRGKNDVGLLEYMIDKTLQTLKLPEDQKGAIKEFKKKNLQKISEMSQSRECFRRQINREFGLPDLQKLTLSHRILAAIFSEQAKVQERHECCEICAGVAPGQELAWAQSLLSEGCN